MNFHFDLKYSSVLGCPGLYVELPWSGGKAAGANGQQAFAKTGTGLRIGRSGWRWYIGGANLKVHRLGTRRQSGRIVWGAFLRSGRPRGPGKAFKNEGGFVPHRFEGRPEPPGPARLQ